MKKILFVEDNNLIARIYSQKLSGLGFKVAVAVDGLEAMKLLPEFRPDLVVLDLLMPRMTGADVLKFLRGHAELKDTPVIVFSNSFLSHLVEQVSTMKVEATLVKAAVTPARLAEIINNTLKLSPKPETPAKTPASIKILKESTKEALKESSKESPKSGSESDGDFVKRIGKEFLERAPIVFKDLREIGSELLQSAKTPAEADHLTALNRKLAFLTQITGMAGYSRTAELSSALEALLFDLTNKPASLNDSARQTIVSTIAFLADRFEQLEPTTEKSLKLASALIVDDDPITNLLVEKSLARAKLSVTAVTDSAKALEKLKKTEYDVLLFDIVMPSIDGLTLCEMARRLPLHKRTPVIFITGMTDFSTYARSILSGGNDLITKPISPNELCVKVITHLLKKS